ncbi:hypothetical protein OAG24_00360 [bacterium]|nr:hypothetical protein [bacterium]
MSFSSCNPAHLFIDLATFSELEGFMYGGPDAITWFVAAIQKANWFAFLPIVLRSQGTQDFNQKNISATLNRSGDYVMHAWFRTQIPQIELVQPGGATGIFLDSSIRWTRNLMHNLFERINISFNELVVQEFDNYWLDVNFQFRKRGSKRIGYRNMIGDIASMTTAVGPGVALGTGGYFTTILPFWFTQDTGIALPVAALPFNEIKINYNIRRWEELIVVFPGTSAVGGPTGPNTGRVATCADVNVFGQTGTKPSLIDPATHAHYAVVHNDERVKMGDAPRDMLIRQVQTTQNAPFKDISSRSTFDIRLSHSIVLFAFMAQNTTLLNFNSCNCGGEWSNYTTEINYCGLDPIAFTTLVYENTCRVAQGSDYYSLIHPDLLHEATPDETGYHIYSYSVLPWDPLKPAGSTNYSKLANVSVSHDMSPAALASAGIGTTSGNPEDQNGVRITYPDSTGALVNLPQKYVHIFPALNWNIGRVANGSFGHPTL